MNWTITGVSTVDYVRVTLTGTFCLASARSISSEIVDEPFWKNGTAILIDNTKIEMGDMDASDIECMTKMMEPLNSRISKSKIAILCSADIQFGFARQFQVKAERYTGAYIRAFRSETAAIEWLITENSFHDKLLAFPTPDFAGAIFASHANISDSPYFGNN